MMPKKITFSEQAENMIKVFNLNKEEIEAWFMEKVFQLGGGDIANFMADFAEKQLKNTNK